MALQKDMCSGMWRCYLQMKMERPTESKKLLRAVDVEPLELFVALLGVVDMDNSAGYCGPVACFGLAN